MPDPLLAHATLAIEENRSLKAERVRLSREYVQNLRASFVRSGTRHASDGNESPSRTSGRFVAPATGLRRPKLNDRSNGEGIRHDEQSQTGAAFLC